MDMESFQRAMADRFKEFDLESGPFFLMTVLTAEVGELAEALKKEDKSGIAEEVGDVIFSALSIANLYDLNIASLLREKYLDRSPSEIAGTWEEPFLGNRKKKLS